VGVTYLPQQRRPLTAFVLGGGGNLGAVQVGMLRALLERGWEPDVIVGCSVGAMNGAALACTPDLDGVAAMEATWLEPSTWEVFGSRLTPFALFRRSSAMVGSDRLRAILHDRLGTRHLDELNVPLHVVATSLRTGRERWLSTGPAVPAVLASAALPAVLPPVTYQGDVLIDGGVVDNVPVAKAVALGADRVVVLHVGNLEKPRPTPRRPFEVLLQAYSIARNHRFESERDTFDDRVELTILPGVDPGSLRRNDFTRSAELIERGHAAAAAHLDELAVAAYA
jgi:NTE family protein